MDIEPRVLQSFRVAKVFPRGDAINSLDFTTDGRYLVSAANDDSIVCHNMETGNEEIMVFSKRFGTELITATHHPHAVICAPRKINQDRSLRYLSLYDNKFLRTFSGHKDRILSVSMSPLDDTFLSSSLDGTIRMWDIRQSQCKGLLNTNIPRVQNRSNLVTSFDKEGVIFAAAIGKNIIKLFDVRKYEAGPFSTFTVSYRSDLQWRNIEFSNDGKLILLTTPVGIIVVDSFEGTLVRHITGYANSNGFPITGTFTPDGKYIICGSEDGLVYVFHSTSGEVVATWNGQPPHPSPVGVVRFNPKTMVAASASKILSLWLPA